MWFTHLATIDSPVQSNVKGGPIRSDSRDSVTCVCMFCRGGAGVSQSSAQEVCPLHCMPRIGWSDELGAGTFSLCTED